MELPKQTHASGSAHREVTLEQHFVAQLVSNQNYLERAPSDYNRPLALDKTLVLKFLRETQTEEWNKLETQYSKTAEAELFKQLEKALKQRGTLSVLRQGLKLIPNIH